MVQYPTTVDCVFAALADPTRRAVLERLGSGSATISELADPFGKSLKVVEQVSAFEQLGGLGLGAPRRPATPQERAAFEKKVPGVRLVNVDGLLAREQMEGCELQVGDLINGPAVAALRIGVAGTVVKARPECRCEPRRPVAG